MTIIKKIQLFNIEFTQQSTLQHSVVNHINHGMFYGTNN